MSVVREKSSDIAGISIYFNKYANVILQINNEPVAPLSVLLSLLYENFSLSRFPLF